MDRATRPASLSHQRGAGHDDLQLDVPMGRWTVDCVGHAPFRRPDLLSAPPGTPGRDTRLTSVHGRSAPPPRRAAELQVKPRAGLNSTAPEHIETHECMLMIGMTSTHAGIVAKRAQKRFCQGRTHQPAAP